MKELFKPCKFRPEVVKRIELCNSILENYARRGYKVTLRSLYYQLVVRNDIENSQQSYKRLVDTLTKARLAGLVDWRALEDLERPLQGGYGGYDSPQDFFDGIEGGYFKDKWEGQPNYVEVWVEKNAQLGVIQVPCARYQVRFMSCKGYLSQTAHYDAGKRFQEKARKGKTCFILHLGDHDPSGIDMTRDHVDKLDMFAQAYDVEVRRIALHMEQIEELHLPPNPAKESDSRFAGYRDRFGDESWELDALEPQYTDALVSRHLEDLIDPDIKAELLEREEAEGAEVDETAAAIARNYDSVRDFLRDNDML